MQRVQDTSVQNPTPYLSPERSKAVREEVNAYLDSLIDEWYRTVPFADHLYESEEVNREYYKLTLREHCWRIRFSRSVQCYNLHLISKINKQAAKAYAQYQADEMLHDDLFLRDALKAGLTHEEIYGTEPTFPTKLLTGFSYYVANHEKPLGVICYSYFVEYTTMKKTPRQVEHLKNTLGADSVKGQQAHLNTDLVDDHEGDMWNILALLIESEDDIAAIKRYCYEVQELLRMFFVEIHRKAIESMVPAGVAAHA
jgi:hypothetical protein